jgi:hypothetical protein
MTTIAASDMPAPRLELRFVYTVECVYSLVLGLGEYDVRRERSDDEGNELPDVEEQLVQIGRTLSTGKSTKRYDVTVDKIDTPFRDGAHAKWDSKQLGGLPIYAVVGDRAMLVDNPPEPNR